MMTPEPRWFLGATENTPADRRFLERLRTLAPSWGAYGITAEQSAAIPLALPFVGVELAHLTTEYRWLWIKFLDVEEGLGFECSWGDITYLDDTGGTDGDIPLTSPDKTTTPEAFAERASDWVAAQASRAVLREEWHGLGRSTRWTFLDHGAVLDNTRTWPWRQRRTPDRVSTELAVSWIQQHQAG
ncbi:hypothetical protein [Agromyces ramosus]|uniref:hypothetical protein n=1 Tax=Agromyces ramosus TaxID=33879 RepID=UPI00102C6578|nr:hypothetical protein [Agromyces ramosus]